MTTTENTEREPGQPAPSAGLLLFFHLIFMVMFLVFGAGIARDGYRAILHRAYTMDYTETTRIARSVWTEAKSAQYAGRDAVVFGIGFLATGLMLLTWASGLALKIVSRTRLTIPLAVYRGLGYLSLLTMVTGSLFLFPIWHFHTLPFYLVVGAFAAVLILPVPAKVRKQVFPVAILAVIFVGMTEFPSFPLFAGIFIALAAGANVLFLWPDLGTRLAPRYRRDKWRRTP